MSRDAHCRFASHLYHCTHIQFISHTNDSYLYLQEIKKLKSSNEELSTLNDKQGKDIEVLESKVISLEQSVKVMKANEDELILSHKEEVAIQNEVSYSMAYSW